MNFGHFNVVASQALADDQVFLFGNDLVMSAQLHRRTFGWDLLESQLVRDFEQAQAEFDRVEREYPWSPFLFNGRLADLGAEGWSYTGYIKEDTFEHFRDNKAVYTLSSLFPYRPAQGLRAVTANRLTHFKPATFDL